MPFFMHMDLLSEFRRVNYGFDNLIFYPGINRLVTFWIESAFYSVTHFFVVNRELLLYLPDPLHSTSSTTQHFIFAGDPYIFRHLFIFKLPYLIFDLLAAVLVYKYFSGSPWRYIALCFWLFNPVTLYASYIFGRFEAIALFFIIATAYSLKTHRLILAAVFFGLALNSREIVILFMPAFVFAVYFSQREGIATIPKALASILLVLFFWRLPQIIEWLFNVKPVFAGPAKLIDLERGISAFIANETAGIFPFFFLYCVGALMVVGSKHVPPHQAFVAAGAASISAFFITGFHSAHYFSWIIPFLVLLIGQVRETTIPTLGLIVCWLCFWCITPTGAYFSGLIATPIHESFFGAGSISQVYQAYFSGHPLLDAGTMRKVIFTAAVACMLVIYIRSLAQLKMNSEREAG